MKNLFRNITAIIEVPIKVALQYSHKLTNTPENNAGAREQDGFIEAPDMNAKKKMSRPTIPPITIPLKNWISLPQHLLYSDKHLHNTT
jgi:hypothetical protein